MAHQPVSPRTYVIVYVMLLGLTALTSFLAVKAHLGALELPVALGIAATKTILVGLFFMHLLHASRLTWVFMAAGVLFLIIMLALTATDYWTRGWMPR